jgi:alanine dehydrogenase
MPALVGRTATLALTQATEPLITRIVQKGLSRAVAEHAELAKGVNTSDGRIVCAAVSAALSRAKTS